MHASRNITSWLPNVFVLICVDPECFPDASVQFAIEKLLLHVIIHAAVYQKKGSNSDPLMSFKKQQLKHHLFNIIISYKKVFSQFYSFDYF